jgi:hypothetical protein
MVADTDEHGLTQRGVAATKPATREHKERKENLKFEI